MTPLPLMARPSVRASLIFLAMLALIAVFADLIASDAPLVASIDGRVRVLPGLAERPSGAPDWAVWAPIRASAHAPSADGPSAPPSGAHLLGTDADGIDVLARTVHGARSIVVVTLSVLGIALVLGLCAGALAGFGPRVADALLARAVELSGALPTLVLLALVRAVEEVPTMLSFVIVLGTLRALRIARLVRGEFLRVSANDFVLAARALGAPARHIAVQHVLPHVMGPVLVAAAFTAASVVALEAALSFVGLGLPPELPAWGALLGQVGRELSATSALLPALGIVATTGACCLLADALDDALGARRGRAHAAY